MNRRLVTSGSFEKKLQLFIKKYPDLEKRISRVLILLSGDPFSLLLKTHKLSGKLSNLFACSIDYHYRIVFYFDEQNVFLLNIGSHDEVY